MGKSVNTYNNSEFRFLYTKEGSFEKESERMGYSTSVSIYFEIDELK